MLQLKLHTITIEDLVPQDHFLRKLDAVLDLSFVYEETEGLYSKKYGRPPIDPVMLVKYVLVGFLYGIPSRRQIEQRIITDVALRWYLGLDLFDPVPDRTARSLSCSDENRPSERCFVACSRKWYGSASRRAWSVDGWWRRIRRISRPTPPVRRRN